MSAVPSNIVPFRDSIALDDLVELYIAAKKAEDTANKFLELQQRQLELGALSPLDFYAQQQRVAQSKVTTAQARFITRTAAPGSG